MKKIKITKKLFTCDGLFEHVRMKRTPDDWISNGHWSIGAKHASLSKAQWARTEDLPAPQTMARVYDMLDPIEDLFRFVGNEVWCDKTTGVFRSTMRNVVLEVFSPYVEGLNLDLEAKFAARGDISEGRVYGALVALDVPVVVMGIRRHF